MNVTKLIEELQQIPEPNKTEVVLAPSWQKLEDLTLDTEGDYPLSSGERIDTALILWP